MALRYSDKIANLYFNMLDIYNVMGCITVYSGTQASSDTIDQNFSNYINSSTYLVAFESVSVSEVDNNRFGSNSVVGQATSSGTATWAIVWNTTALASISSDTYYMIVPCSGITGNGVVRVSDTNISSGTSYTLSDFSLFLNNSAS